ncbi:Site-specific recombinase XerD [Fodinibius roseus]|uniref:Site-specific recombinase XerD n=1 Tax=Fodinibius roseus TaxID=1194090 RepID=A0A1M4X3E7_9BACT|nr:site-specific integrase [Fodinibius roseus]SHE88006.1 Site-specific recombinase XerD [Fodinibius roseus]
MPKKHLNDQFIRNLTPQGKRIEYFDQHLIDPETSTLKRVGVKGLLIRLTKAGNIYFYYSYWFDNKSKRFKIGNYPNLSLSEARDKARKLAYKVNNNIDPQVEKIANKKKSKPKIFDYLVKHFKNQHLPTLRESTQKTYRNRIETEILPAFKGMTIENMTRGVIIELLEDIAVDRNQPTHSNRIRAILSSMFSFAVQREIAEYNPVKTIKPLGNENQRDRVLNEEELRRLWEHLLKLHEPLSSVFRILLLLGQRKGETCRMKWENIKDNVWTIPKEQTKADRKHSVPLTPLAVDIISDLKNESPYVFESNRNKGQPIKWLHNSFKGATKQAKITDIRIHDLRRTAATYMAESGTDRTILGKVLNHKGLAGDSQVTARYDRYAYMDEKRQALNRWSYRLKEIISNDNS